MSQTPVTVTYSLEEVLGEIKQSIKEVNQKLDSIEKDIAEIKIGQVKLEAELKEEIKNLETEIKGIGKRLDTQEFINRSVVVSFVLALAAGVVKLFFPNFPS